MDVLRPGSVLLWLRAWLLSSAFVLSGTVAHASAEGLLPSWRWLLLLSLGGTTAAAALLRRPASGVRLVALLLAGQTVVHLALTVLAGHRAAHHEMAPEPSTSTSPWLTFVHHEFEHLAEQRPSMVLAHLLGAVALALWLAVGERALWGMLCSVTCRLAERASRTLALVGGGRPPLTCPRAWSPPSARPSVVRRLSPDCQPSTLRGPPQVLR